MLFVIAGLYVLLGWQYAIQTPDWQIPDEPAHYNYIRQLADEGKIPVIQAGDWDTEYQNLLTSTGFDPAYLSELNRIQYEDHQPPLYYLLATPLYAASDGNLTMLRLFSVLIGLGVVLSAFAVIWLLFPESPWLALSTAAFVAFLPQNLAFLSGVNNDPLAELMVGITLLAVAFYLKQPQITSRDSLLLGLLVGIALLTKVTIYFLAGIAGIAVLLRGKREGWPREFFLRQLGYFLIPALLLGGVWWGRNLSVYGGTDFIGLQRHDRVAAGQLQTETYIERDLNGSRSTYYKNFAYTTFHSFWGQFGWMAVPMHPRLYKLLLLAVMGLLIGAGLYFARNRKTLTVEQWEMLLLFDLVLVFVAAAYMLYNLQFVQFQGRYLYPALIPFGFTAAVGLSGWVELASKRASRWTPVLMVLLLVLLAWYALETYIIGVLPN
ncbi:MAG: DUF2142 domain-containing protein [Anaerolineae bacterium]|nr:DUF2142 domain-containing protein [Anaerolineae bacterium]